MRKPCVYCGASAVHTVNCRTLRTPETMSDATKAAEKIARALHKAGWVMPGYELTPEVVNSVAAIITAHPSPTYAEGRRAGLLEAAKCMEAYANGNHNDRNRATAIRALAEGGGV